jgi:hypothetical protein
MNNVYLLANSFDRFHSDLGGCNEPSKICQGCGYPIIDKSAHGCFFWDKKFGFSARSIKVGNDVFWAEFSMLATSLGVDILQSLKLPISVGDAKCLSGIDAFNRYKIEAEDIAIPLSSITPSRSIDIASTTLRICELCGKFADHAWRINGLSISREALKQGELFMLNQNRGIQIFATERIKKRIDESGIKGIGFYKAGSIL